MASIDQASNFSVGDEEPSLDTESGRESVATSGIETDLDIEEDFLTSLDGSGHDDCGGISYVRACQNLGVVPVKRFLDELRGRETRLCHRNLGVNGSKAIAGALIVNNTITNLDLSSNTIGDKGAMYIVSAVVSRDLVKVLVLAGNNLGRQSAEVFAELLQRSTKLTTLDLSRNRFDDKDCAVITKALANNKFLEELNLSHNKLTEAAGVSLGKALAINIKLKQLNLSWNRIRSNGTVALATGITANGNLTGLNISWNGVDDVGVSALAHGLVTSSVLQDLQLSSNNISDKGLQEIVRVLEKCNLQSLDVSRNPLIGSNIVIEVLLKFLLDGKTPLKSVDIGQTRLTKECMDILAELKQKRPGIRIRHCYKREDMSEAMAPKRINPYEILREYAAMRQLHSFQLFRFLGESEGFRETMPCDVFENSLKKLKLFDDHHIHEIVSRLDRDHNGVIDYSEFMVIFAREKTTEKVN